MPRHATGGSFDYADAHRTYTTGLLSGPSWSREPDRKLSRSRDGLVRLPGTATTLEPMGSPDGRYSGAYLVSRGVKPDAYVIRYHETDIVTLYRDGRVRLDNGGHPTVTTVRKMHEYTPEDISVSGRDIVARRADADPRIEIAARSRRPLARLDYVDTTATLPAPLEAPPAPGIQMVEASNLIADPIAARDYALHNLSRQES